MESFNRLLVTEKLFTHKEVALTALIVALQLLPALSGCYFSYLSHCGARVRYPGGIALQSPHAYIETKMGTEFLTRLLIMSFFDLYVTVISNRLLQAENTIIY